MHFLFGLVLICSTAPPSPGQPGSHKAWLEKVRSAGTRELRAALRAFDDHLRAHPKDAVAAVERCRLIGGSQNSEDEPIDTQAPTFTDCLDGLEREFPDSGPALVYRMDGRHGADAIAFGEKVLANPRVELSAAEHGHLYERLAQSERNVGHPQAAARRARQAMAADPSIDLTELIGQVLLQEQRKSEAVAILSSRPEGPPYTLLQKARHLADAGAFFRARWMAKRAADMPGYAPDHALLGRIAEGLGKIDQAREAFQKSRTAWNNADIRTRLFQLSLAGNDASAADRAYQELRDQGLSADPLARQRLALQRKFPRTTWRARDLAGLGALAAFILGLSIVPLVALLPLHTFVLWRRVRRAAPDPAAEPGAWWFRHVYLTLALIFVAQFVSLYIFAYDGLAELLTPLRHSDASAPDIARFGLFYIAGLVASLGVLLIRQPRRLHLLGPGSWTLWKCAGQAFVSLIIGYAVAGFTFAVLQRPAALSVDSLIASLVKTYGLGVALIVVAVLVPIAEELIFRSVLLDVFSRHLRFRVANLLQATIFAAMHADPVRFAFYTVFGLLAGRLRRASGGLLASIALHVANNAVAVLLITAVGAAGLRKPSSQPAPEPALLACAKVPAAEAPKGPMTLNNLAWKIAIDPDASRECLLRAEDAADGALRQIPEVPGFLDTKATVLFRQGRFDEAIDLERAAAQRAPTQMVFFSQIDRFLRARQAGRSGPVLIGTAAGDVTLSVDPQGKAVVVQMRSRLDDGFVLFGRRPSDAAMIRLSSASPEETSYRLDVSSSGQPAPFDIALLDARGCDDCKAGTWRFDFAAHDAIVDRYP
jgi:membrane protease YdiL (CAAX protease family)